MRFTRTSMKYLLAFYLFIINFYLFIINFYLFIINFYLFIINFYFMQSLSLGFIWLTLLS